MPTASYPLIKESVKKKLKASKQICWLFQTTRFTTLKLNLWLCYIGIPVLYIMSYNELQSTENMCLQTTDNTIPIQQPVKHHYYLHVNIAGKNKIDWLIYLC